MYYWGGGFWPLIIIISTVTVYEPKNKKKKEKYLGCEPTKRWVVETACVHPLTVACIEMKKPHISLLI